MKYLSYPTLLEPLDIKDRVVTLEAKHTPKKNRQKNETEKQAYYFFTVKGNQLNGKLILNNFQIEAQKPDYETIDKGHDRLETRRIWNIRPSMIIWIFHIPNKFAAYNAMYLIVNRAPSVLFTIYGITDLTPIQANPQRLLKRGRGRFPY